MPSTLGTNTMSVYEKGFRDNIGVEKERAHARGLALDIADCVYAARPLIDLLAARDAEIARLRVPGALETGRNGGWQEMIETMREQNKRTNRALTEERARVAQLEAALRQAALDLGNAAALMMLANMTEECAVFRKCEEAARAALETR